MGGAANANILLNAKKAVGRGFELDLQAYLTDNLLVTLGSSYNDTEIQDKDLNVAGCAQCTVTNAPVLDPVTHLPTGRYYIDGNPLPQAPKWTHNLTARWSMPTGDGAEFYAFTDWVYRSGEFLPCTSPRSSPASRCSRAACASATTGTTAVRPRRVRSQHHQPDPRRRRHRLQQPDRHDQRAAAVGLEFKARF